jgi:NitT/TauT family transport system ATP-binding protein
MKQISQLRATATDARAEAAALRIDISGVTKEYQGRSGSVRALESVQNSIPAGQFVSLLGPSGCGKSTLMRIIAGLEKPSAGKLLIGGKNVDRPHPELGMIFQRDLLLPWRTVLQNVLLQADVRAMPRHEFEKRALALLDQVGLTEFKNKYPRELSGGMRQRVAICRAILHDPRLLLMDEPYAALDAMTRDQMAVDLSAMVESRSTTVVFVTHSISEAVFLSDRILVMSPRPGKIVADIQVDLPRPRRLHVRDLLRFGQLVGEVTKVFEDLGVFRSWTQPAGNQNGEHHAHA